MTSRSSEPTVVLLGRPNVGKSTLFNRITGKRRSIVAPVAGTTRDAVEAKAEWGGRAFSLVDTGGLFGATTDPLHHLVVEHGLKAIQTADVLVFIVDAQEGLVPADEEIAQRVRLRNKPVIFVVNKTDDKRAAKRAPEFAKLGFNPAFEITAEHGTGVFELLDEIVERLPPGGPAAKGPDPDEEDEEEEVADSDAPAAAAGKGAKRPRKPRVAKDPLTVETAVAIVGRPNVGKSSLMNRLLREERVMVSEVPGTTRDTVDVELQWHKRPFRIVDTAGIRKPGRVARSGQVEMVSVVLAKRAIERADVAVLVVDAVEGAGDQEGAIAGAAVEAGCGIVIAVNKWDLVKGQGQEWVAQFDDRLRFQLKFLDFAPLIHMSALTGERTPKLLETVDKVAQARRKRVTTGELNRFLEKVTARNPPVSKGRREVRIMYAAQTSVEPPAFVLFTNVATELHFSYERFIINQLRETFGFEGVPIRLTVRRRGGKERD